MISVAGVLAEAKLIAIRELTTIAHFRIDGSLNQLLGFLKHKRSHESPGTFSLEFVIDGDKATRPVHFRTMILGCTDAEGYRRFANHRTLTEIEPPIRETMAILDAQWVSVTALANALLAKPPLNERQQRCMTRGEILAVLK